MGSFKKILSGTTAAAVLAGSLVSQAAPAAARAPIPAPEARSPIDVPPHNMKFLGADTYVQTKLQKLTSPDLIYVNIPKAHMTDAETAGLKIRWGWAVPVAGENKKLYGPETRLVYSTYYGGDGLNGNLGEGRAGASEDESYKGIGPVKPMKSVFTEDGHSSGTIGLHEAVVESIWSKLMALELPYGASNVRAVVGVGSKMEDYTGPNSIRVVFVRDDFMRPGHFILNPTAEKAGRGDADLKRVREAIKKLPLALPQPDGLHPKTTRDRLANGLGEMIDRLAIQAGYQWSHSIYAAAMSPTNVSLLGGAADFGAFTALDGYARVQMMDDARANGDCEEILVLRQLHESLEQNAPAKWQAVIGNSKDWEARFWKTYHREIGQEMLNLSGSFPEFAEDLRNDPSADRLAATLLEVAKAGNENIVTLWDHPMPSGAGTYNLGRVLTALAQSPLDLAQLKSALVREMKDPALRMTLAKDYLDYYQKVERLALAAGIEQDAARKYRLEAVQIRNKKMDQIFGTSELHAHVQDLVERYARTRNKTAITQFIEEAVNVSRRNFKDAAPFTVVAQQRYDAKTGVTKRDVFDARLGQMIETTSNPETPLESSILNHKRAQTCEAIF